MNTANAPRLRFKEFSTDWKTKPLGSIAELTSSKRVYLSEYVPEGIPFYRGKEISELRAGKNPKDVLYISNQSYEKYKNIYGVPKTGDILITAVGTLGNTLLIENQDKFYFKDGNLIWIKNNKENSKFVDYSLQYNYKDILNTSIGSSQRALTIVGLNKLQINLPEYREQQKIADFLSAVDNYIKNLTSQKEELEKYKKGMMQKLFSQDFRFKDNDGKMLPNWNISKLGEITKRITKGTTPTTLGFSYTEEGINFIKIESISNNGSILEEKIGHINEQCNAALSRSQLKRNDILFSIAGALGRVTLVNSNLLPANTNQALAIITPNDNINPEYLTEYLRSAVIQNALNYLKVGLAQSNISLEQISNFEIPLPSKIEQQKIMSFLNSINELLNIKKQQLNNVLQWKKGLMQEIFV